MADLRQSVLWLERKLRLADGPDEAHREVVGKWELKKQDRYRVRAVRQAG